MSVAHFRTQLFRSVSLCGLPLHGLAVVASLRFHFIITPLKVDQGRNVGVHILLYYSVYAQPLASASSALNVVLNYLFKNLRICVFIVEMWVAPPTTSTAVMSPNCNGACSINATRGTHTLALSRSAYRSLNLALEQNTGHQPIAQSHSTKEQDTGSCSLGHTVTKQFKNRKNKCFLSDFVQIVPFFYSVLVPFLPFCAY